MRYLFSSPAVDRLGWILDGINGAAGWRGDVADVLAPEFAALVPPEVFTERVRQRAAAFAPGTVIGFDTGDHTARARVRVRDGSVQVVHCPVEPARPHRIRTTTTVALIPPYLTPRLPADFTGNPKLAGRGGGPSHLGSLRPLPARTRTKGSMDLIIGTYTEQLPHVHGKADGVLTASFDPASGLTGAVTTLALAPNPSYLAASAAGDHVYVVHETVTFEEQQGGGITAYARDLRTGELTRLNARATIGEAPCHVALDRTGRFVLTANYGLDAGSVTVYRVEPDGRLGDLTDHVKLAGAGPDPVRQAGSHAHMIASDPVTGDILVADLGADTVLVYALDAAGRLVPGAKLAATPGAGPRHLAFHPDGRHLFIVNELDSTVCALRRDDDGHFAVTGRVSTRGLGAGGQVLAGAGGQNLAGAIRVSPSGRHVLVSNRGDDSLAVLRFDLGAGALSLGGVTSGVGACPRDFVIAPDGRHVIVAGQDSDHLTSYAFDDEAGALRLLYRAVAPTPVCLVLV